MKLCIIDFIKWLIEFYITLGSEKILDSLKFIIMYRNLQSIYIIVLIKYSFFEEEKYMDSGL